jgi:hypothetical protein
MNSEDEFAGKRKRHKPWQIAYKYDEINIEIISKELIVWRAEIRAKELINSSALRHEYCRLQYALHGLVVHLS